MTVRTKTPQWKLRRLAARVPRIVERRGAESPALIAYAGTVGAKAKEYAQAYDEAIRHSVKWRREMEEGRSALRPLQVELRAWLPLLKRDIAGFDASAYGDQPNVADDLIEDCERLLSLIEAHQELTYRDAALEALRQRVDAAAKEWAEAEAADQVQQKLQAAVRTTGAALQAELVLLRRTLQAAFGRSDKDYQKLRADRAIVADEDDTGIPAIEEPTTLPVAAAPVAATTPAATAMPPDAVPATVAAPATPAAAESTTS